MMIHDLPHLLISQFWLRLGRRRRCLIPEESLLDLLESQVYRVLHLSESQLKANGQQSGEHLLTG